MKTTLRIDDDLLRELTEIAQRENVSLTETVNHIIRCGLRNSAETAQARHPYREQVFLLGEACGRFASNVPRVVIACHGTITVVVAGIRI